ncbi:MAG: ABC transporter C-terminal domain-containing protein, partial [Puniceicoccales bacterium]
LAPLRKKSQQLEANIAEWETEHADLEKKMMDPDFFKKGAETKDGMERYDELKTSIERAYADWETIQEQIATLEV